jgi:hypothetical protein
MPSDLSIPPVAAGQSLRPAEAARAAPPAAPAGGAATPGTPNPTLRLDPALGLVVIEFVSKSGAITSSIPSQRELTAYQDGTAQPPSLGTGRDQATPPASVERKA